MSKGKKTCGNCGKRTRKWREFDGNILCEDCDKPVTEEPVTEEGDAVVLQEGETVLDAYIAADIHTDGYDKWRQQPHVTNLRSISDNFSITLTEQERTEAGRSTAFLLKELERKEEDLKEYSANVKAEIKTLKKQIKERSEEARTGTKSLYLTAAFHYDHLLRKFFTVDPSNGRVLVERDPYPGEQIPLPVSKPESDPKEPEPESEPKPEPPAEPCCACEAEPGQFRVTDELDTDELYCRECLGDVDESGLGDNFNIVCTKCGVSLKTVKAACAHVCETNKE